jgi:hypothetical protein
VIAGSEIRVLDAQGSQLDSLPYSVEAAVASAFFTELFGAEPVVTTVESDGPCMPNATIELWDDAFRLAHGDMVLPEGQRVVVAADAAEAHGIALETPGGVAVGDPIDLLEADIPVELRNEPVPHDDGVFVQVDYDIVEEERMPIGTWEAGQAVYWGAKATGEDSVVNGMVAPTMFVDHC